MNRFPIQIVAMPHDPGGFAYQPPTPPRLVALCSDGTLWQLLHNGWNRIPPIPEEACAKCGVTSHSTDEHNIVGPKGP